MFEIGAQACPAPRLWAKAVHIAFLEPGEALGPGNATVAMSLVSLLRYQFNPAFFQTTVTAQILLKALTNLPHTDFTLCKCMIDQAHVSFQFLGLGVCGRDRGKRGQFMGKWSESSATNTEYLLSLGLAQCWMGLRPYGR